MLNKIRKIVVIAFLSILFIIPVMIKLDKCKAETNYNYWPTENWEISTPEEQGLDSSKIEQLADYVEQDNYDYDSVIIVKNGYIVYENYFNSNFVNSTHHLFSVTKSFLSALIGIAIEESYILNLQQKVVDFCPDYTITNLDEWKQEMTIEHLMTMTSGIEWVSDFPRWYDMMAAPNQVQFMLDLPMEHEPGSHFKYNSGGCQLVSAILQNKTGKTAYEYAQEVLFEPIGIDKAYWQMDKQGINIGGTLLYTTPRHMARLGYLYLNNGTWDGQQIVPKDWVINSSTSYIRSSMDNTDYGYYWWLDRDGEYYYAWGSEGQKIFVVPDYNMVVVFTASDDTHEPYEYLLENYILPANLDYTPKASIEIILAFSLTMSVFVLQRRKQKRTRNGFT